MAATFGIIKCSKGMHNYYGPYARIIYITVVSMHLNKANYVNVL